jgi:hypothetical protein
MGKISDITRKSMRQTKINDAVSRSFIGKVKAEILQDNKSFVCEGDLIKVDRFKRKKMYRFFLFSDYLYYADISGEKIDESKKPKTFISSDDIPIKDRNSQSNDNEIGSSLAIEYVIHQKLHLATIQIKNNESKSSDKDDTENVTFFIDHPTKSFNVIAESLETKNHWLTALDSTIEKLRLRTEGSDNEDESDGNIVPDQSNVNNTNDVSGNVKGLISQSSDKKESKSYEPIRYEGVFQKQGHVNIFSWKQRRFVLELGKLQYFDEKNNLMGELPDLTGFEANIASADTLKILCAGKKGLTLYITEEVKEEGKGGGGSKEGNADQRTLIATWKTRVEEHINYCNSKTNTASSTNI